MKVSSLLVLAAACSSVARAKQAFEEEPRYREVNPGQDVIMTCRLEGLNALLKSLIVPMT